MKRQLTSGCFTGIPHGVMNIDSSGEKLKLKQTLDGASWSDCETYKDHLFYAYPDHKQLIPSVSLTIMSLNFSFMNFPLPFQTFLSFMVSRAMFAFITENVEWILFIFVVLYNLVMKNSQIFLICACWFWTFDATDFWSTYCFTNCIGFFFQVRKLC